MEQVKLGRQLLVVTENKVGMLAQVSACVANEKVNIQALNAYALEGQAFFRIITDNNAQAKRALESKGYRVEEQEVVLLELPNRPGRLQKIADQLKGATIDLSYLYGTTCSSGCNCLLVLAADNNARAVALLKK